MKLADLATSTGAQILTDGTAAEAEIFRVYAGDRISDLLNQASDNTLLVTNLASQQLIRLAELMDVPGLCLVNGRRPEQEVVDLANAHGTMIMTSPVSVFETCGRLYLCLFQQNQTWL